MSDACGCGDDEPRGAEEQEREPERLWQIKELQFAALSGVFLLAAVVTGFRDAAEPVVLALEAVALLAGAYTFVPSTLKRLVKGKIGVGTLMTIAAVGAVILGEVGEAAMLAFLFSISEGLEEYSLARTRRGLRALLSLVPDEATVLRDGAEKTVAPADLQIGDRMLVKPGERVATDGIIRLGRTALDVSAITGQGLDELLEAIALQAEILELKANPDRAAEGAVIEAQLDVGRGPVATVLVQKGTLHQGDIFVVGEQWGKVRALINDRGDRVEEAGPSVPVEVLGLNGTPEAGDVLNVVDTEAQAREIAEYREQAAKDKRAAAGAATTLDQLLAKAKADENVKELPILVKADVQGSAEAIVQAMEKIGNDEVRVRVLHSGVGAITETDVGLAEASGAPILGFNVRANASARNTANQKGVELRYYSVIYDLVDDVKAAASGLLSAEIRENFIGYAQIKEVFKVSGVGKVAGCLVTEGVARRSAGVRLLRDDVVIHEGTLKTLKRFKDEVSEVQSGQECGMAFENYDDVRPGDVIEIFEREEVTRTLD